jgi:putative transposase
MSIDFRRGRHVVFKLQAHLVFTPKYRRGVITERVWQVLRAAFERVCVDFGATLDEGNYEADHAHLLVSYPPKVSLSGLVNSLKGVSAYDVRRTGYEEVTRALWGRAFWSPSYCAVSCGGAPLEVIKRYIEGQRANAGGEQAGSLPPRRERRGSRGLTKTVRSSAGEDGAMNLRMDRRELGACYRGVP